MLSMRDNLIWLSQQRTANNGEPITYKRASQPHAAPIPLTAVRGRTPFRTEALGDGRVQIVRTDADWFVYPASLVDANGQRFEPANGDWITDADGVVFELKPVNGEPCARLVGLHNDRLRLHSMRKR